MECDRNGHIISGMYEGISYAGRVINSRVKSGGEVQYTIDLFEPIYIDGERHDRIKVSDLFALADSSRVDV